MTADGVQSKKMIDPFEIGIYAMEVVVVAAIVYAIIALPMYLKPAT